MKPPLLILCATDLSADADLAVVAADDIARLFGSRLVFVHAVPYPAPAQVLFPHLVKGTTDRLMAVSRVASETVAARVASLTARTAGGHRCPGGRGRARTRSSWTPRRNRPPTCW